MGTEGFPAVVGNPHCPDGVDWKWMPRGTLKGLFAYEHLAEQPYGGGESLLDRARAGGISWETEQGVMRCTTPRLRGYIAGPFSTGSGNWTSIIASLPQSVIGAGDHVEQFVGDAISSDGVALPPEMLKVHHLHMHHGDAVHWFETHGDSPMPDTSVGHVRPLPKGRCLVHKGLPTRVETQLANDGAHRIDNWYLRVAFWVRPVVDGASPCKPVSKLLFQNPTTKFAETDGWHRYDAGNQPGLFWWVYRVPRTGRVVSAGGSTWKHAHAARYGGIVVVRGRHEQLVPHVARSFSEVAHLEDGVRTGGKLNGDFKDVRQSIIESALRRDEFMCALDPESEALDTSMRIECADVSFTAGEWITLYAPSEIRAVPTKTPFAQHTMLFWIFEDAAHSLGEYVEVMPRAYGRWIPDRVHTVTTNTISGKKGMYQWETAKESRFAGSLGMEAHEFAPEFTTIV
jgi:hypothetical protein